jgi:hypothetical protein
MVVLHTGFWTIGTTSDEAVSTGPWWELTLVAALVLGVVGRKCRYVLLALAPLTRGRGADRVRGGFVAGGWRRAGAWAPSCCQGRG